MLQNQWENIHLFFPGLHGVKLTGDLHAEALKLKGAVLFDPSGKGRAMKEWVQVAFTHKNKWPEYAKSAMEFVKKTRNK